MQWEKFLLAANLIIAKAAKITKYRRNRNGRRFYFTAKILKKQLILLS
jgi:hypothetical protein